MRGTALRRSSAFRFDSSVVEDCLDPGSVRDRLFARGWRAGSASLTRAARVQYQRIAG